MTAKHVSAGSIDIKRAVKGMVRITSVRKGEIWYQTQHGEIFSVPFADMEDASFNAEEKGMLLMRYMRKWNKALEDES